MTLEQREKLNNFKSVLSMMYGTTNVMSLTTDKSEKALVRVKCKDLNNELICSEAFFWYELLTGNSQEVHIRSMDKLPISENYLILEESGDGENTFIKIIDKETLEVVEKTVIDICDRHKNLISQIRKVRFDFGYSISKDRGYVGIKAPTIEDEELSIHGKHTGLDYTFTKLRNNIFISNVQSLIKVYDNIEDMNIIKEINLESFDDRVYYYPILNPRHLKTNLPQVLFINVPGSDSLYAYNFEDNKIHVVKDTRYKISVYDFIDKLKQCLETSDKDRKEKYTVEYHKFKEDLNKQRLYERTQFRLDCDSLMNLDENKFGLNKVTYNNGSYLTPRTLVQCVKEYQRDFNGESHIKHRLKPKINGGFRHIRGIDKEVMLSLTPYKIKSMKLMDDIKQLQDKENLGKLIITDETLSFEELITREGLH